MFTLINVIVRAIRYWHYLGIYTSRFSHSLSIWWPCTLYPKASNSNKNCRVYHLRHRSLAMLVKMYPFAWAGDCHIGIEGFCGPAVCSVSGSWHIAWQMPLNGIMSDPVNGCLTLIGAYMRLLISWSRFICRLFMALAFCRLPLSDRAIPVRYHYYRP